MSRTRALVLTLAAFGSIQPASGGQQPLFRASADVVSIDVSVTAGRAPVTGLHSADFTLLDNGVRQSLDAVAIETLPIDLTFVVDVSPSASDGLPGVRAALERIRKALQPADRLRVVTCGVSVRSVVPMTHATDIAPLDTPTSPVHSRAGGRSIFVQPTVEGTSLADAVFYALAWPGGPERRHLIIVFTDGIDTWSTIEPGRLPDLAGRADAVMHFVMSAPRPGPAEPRTGTNGFSTSGSSGVVYTHGLRTPAVVAAEIASWNGLSKAVERTGGLLHNLTNVDETFREILADFRSSYLLRYTLTNVGRAGWHDITVKIIRPGSFTIRARKGYVG